MKLLIVYDSQYGNTEKIARAIYEALGSVGEGECLRVGEVKPEYPDGHYVSGTEGPLKEDKLEQAVELGEKIAGSIIFA